ncbi:MAG: branched-chain amino acid ABC transporter permease [Ardenticatenales bacterium]|nr:branched-chain amino acid ABC transporter permease [Ardenticatenales bacterium]
MNDSRDFSWLDPVRTGLTGGTIAILVALVGMVGKFSERPIIEDVISLGQLLFLGITFLVAYNAVQHAVQTMPTQRSTWIISGVIAGTLSALMLALLVIIGGQVNLRSIFINASPQLYRVLTFEQPTASGIPLLLAMGAALGALAGLSFFLPPLIKRAVIWGVSMVLLLGMLGDQLLLILSNNDADDVLKGWLLASKGLTVSGTLITFLVAAGLNLLWNAQEKSVRQALDRRPAEQKRWLRWGLWLLLALLVIQLPAILGPYHSEVLNQVGIFLLLGLGLNIVVGFAGMLDLGYVAFYAIGAYTVGVLTSAERIGTFNFWAALPIAIILAVAAGVMLGIPVLRMRGDYLAIVTLGFGEIIQRLVLSDWLRPWLGGAQGVAAIPPIVIPFINLTKPDTPLFYLLSVSGPNKPQRLFYFILVACLLAAFIASRLKDSRLGRAWMAIREDEDVAEAMGIHLVSTKLMAFAVGAGLSGLSGVLFGAKIGSIYPNSFGLLISINILALIIVGGMGSIPGVLVGALALVGLPELLREFAEFRLLVYGAVLVFMMLNRPEGLIPDEAHKRELHDPMPDTLPDGEPEVVPIIST